VQKVEVKQVIAAAPGAVWNRYTDYCSWTDWAGLGTVTLAREGTDQRNGVGCVRVVSNGGVRVFEEVLSFDPPHRMTYRVVRGGIPIKDHLGEVVFSSHEQGTLVTWRCRLNSKIPGLGGLFHLIVRGVFSRTLRALARQQLG